MTVICSFQSVWGTEVFNFDEVHFNSFFFSVTFCYLRNFYLKIFLPCFLLETLWLPFISSYPIALVKLLVWCWIELIRVDILAFPDLKRNTLFFTIWYDMSCKILIDALYQVGEVSFCSWFVKYIYTSFIMQGYWIFFKSFSVFIETTMRFLSFLLLIWCIILIYFHVLKQPCILG